MEVGHLLLLLIHLRPFPVFTLPGCGETPLLLLGVPPLGALPAGGRRPTVAAQLGGGAGPPPSPGPHQQGVGPPAMAHLLLPHPGRAATQSKGASHLVESPTHKDAFQGAKLVQRHWQTASHSIFLMQISPPGQSVCPAEF